MKFIIKKACCSVLFLVLIQALCAQPGHPVLVNKYDSAGRGFTVSGELVGYPAGEKIYLEYRIEKYNEPGRTMLDSTIVINGGFSFKGAILHQPVYCDLLNGNRETMKRFWLENTDVTLADHGQGIVVEGSVTEAEFERFLEETNIDELDARVKTFNSGINEAENAGDSARKATLENAKRAEYAAWNERAEQFIRRNPGSFVSVNHIWNKVNLEKMRYAPFSRLFGYLDSNLKATSSGRMLADKLAIMKQTTVGHVFPDFSQPDTKGNPVKLSDFRGGYLLLTFSGSWNKAYRATNASKRRLYDLYHEKGFEILDVLFDNSKTKLEEVIATDQVKWSVISDLKGWNNEAVTRFAIESISRTFLLDKNGVVIMDDFTPEELEAKLRTIF